MAALLFRWAVALLSPFVRNRQWAFHHHKATNNKEKITGDDASTLVAFDSIMTRPGAGLCLDFQFLLGREQLLRSRWIGDWAIGYPVLWKGRLE